MIISRSVLRRMKNVSDKSCRGNQNTHFVQFFFFKNRAVFGVMGKNIEVPDRLQMAVRSMPIARWITKATNTNSDYVIFIAFPVQQWLGERTLVLHYACIACLAGRYVCLYACLCICGLVLTPTPLNTVTAILTL